VTRTRDPRITKPEESREKNELIHVVVMQFGQSSSRYPAPSQSERKSVFRIFLAKAFWSDGLWKRDPVHAHAAHIMPLDFSADLTHKYT